MAKSHSRKAHDALKGGVRNGTPPSQLGHLPDVYAEEAYKPKPPDPSERDYIIKAAHAVRDVGYNIETPRVSRKRLIIPLAKEDGLDPTTAAGDFRSAVEDARKSSRVTYFGLTYGNMGNNIVISPEEKTGLPFRQATLFLVTYKETLVSQQKVREG